MFVSRWTDDELYDSRGSSATFLSVLYTVGMLLAIRPEWFISCICLDRYVSNCSIPRIEQTATFDFWVGLPHKYPGTATMLGSEVSFSFVLF